MHTVYKKGDLYVIYIPIKKPKKATYVSAVSLVVAITLYTVGELAPVPKMPFQLVALGLIAFGVMLIARYLLTDYKYVITDSDRAGKEPSFSIVKMSGKRETPVATFDFVSVYQCDRCKKTSEFEKKYGKVDKVFNYCTNYRADDRYALAIEFNGMKVLIFIEADVIFERELVVRSPSTAGGG